MDSIASIPDAADAAAVALAAAPTLVVRVGRRLYGCDVSDAREIIPMRRPTRLPGAPPFVRGLINVRGTIVTVLDLGARLDPARAADEQEGGAILLVTRRDRLVGVAVDEVRDVRALAVDGTVDTAVAAAGDDASGIRSTLVRGIAMLDGVPLPMLDLEAVITQVLLA